MELKIFLNDIVNGLIFAQRTSLRSIKQDWETFTVCPPSDMRVVIAISDY